MGVGAAEAGGGRRVPAPARQVARGRGGRRLAGGRTGGAGGGGARRAGHPKARPRTQRSSPCPARAPAAARPRLAATMSTGLRYKSKLATPGELGARPRLCPRRPPASHCVSPFLPPPAGLDPPGPGPRPDPDPDPAEDKQVRALRRSASRLSPFVAPTPPAPRRDPAPAGRHPALSR